MTSYVPNFLRSLENHVESFEYCNSPQIGLETRCVAVHWRAETRLLW